MAIEQSGGNPCSYKRARRTPGAARAEAVGGDAKWIDPCRHGDVESSPPLLLQEQVDAFKTSEPGPGPDPDY